ncbi:MAG: class I SAM-dependent methyltransferase [Beijerinckiaceae bacterium]
MAHADSKRTRNAPLQLRFADEARFFKAWVENPVATGAVSPSGRFLARTMARYVDPALPGPVIELGPGTGPVTQALIERGVAPERLVLVEYDEAFCTLLRSRFPGATVIQGDAYDLPATLAGRLSEPAASVVSSLPLLNKPEADRISMLQAAFDLLGPQGNVVQFTYGMVSPVPRRTKHGEPVACQAEASPPVWLNIPPARVWVYRPAGDVVQMTDGRAKFFGKLKEQTIRVRDEILEKRDRIETELRLARETVRIDFELRAAHLREVHLRDANRLEAQFDKHFGPALSLLRKFGENRRRER